MERNSNDDPTTVLARTKDIPKTPFKCSLEYSGIKVTAHVLKELTNKLSGEPDREKLKDELGVSSVNIEDSEFGSGKVQTDGINATSTQELIFIWNRMVKRDQHDYVIYENDNSVRYAIRLEFRFAYRIIPNDSWSKIPCLEENVYHKIPDSVPRSEIDGTVKSKNNKKLGFEEDSIWTRFLQNGLSLELNPIRTQNDNLYAFHELTKDTNIENPEKKNISEYCSGEVYVSDNEYVIKCDSDDGPVTFRIPLTSLGTLPEWFENRVDVDELINKLDNDNISVIFEIRETDDSADKNWVSEFGDRELLGIK